MFHERGPSFCSPQWGHIVEVTTKPVFHFFLDEELFSWRRFSLLTKIITLKKYAPHGTPHKKNTPHRHKIVFWVRKSLSSREKIFVKRENLRQENITDFGFSCDPDNMCIGYVCTVVPMEQSDPFYFIYRPQGIYHCKYFLYSILLFFFSLTLLLLLVL